MKYIGETFFFLLAAASECGSAACSDAWEVNMCFIYCLCLFEESERQYCNEI